MPSENYRYAYDSNFQLIDVNKLTKQNKGAFAPFFCVGCRQEMVPHLGNQMIHHFKHKQSCNCTGETYLHNLAKTTFYTRYSECLKNKTPYILGVPHRAVCNKHKDTLGTTCDRKIYYEHVDLTELYDEVHLERKTSKGFIADVLLSDSGGQLEELLIEIVVTHPCSQDKIDSKHKIIELKVDSESSLAHFKSQIILPPFPQNNKESSITHYNIKVLQRKKNLCEGGCDVYQMPTYILTSAGEIKRRLFPVEVVAEGFNVIDVSLCKVFAPVQETEFGSDEEVEENYKSFVRIALSEGLFVQNCYACKHHGAAFNSHFDAYCFKKRRGIMSPNSEALQCNAFETFNNVHMFDKAIKKQEERASSYSKNKFP